MTENLTITYSEQGTKLKRPRRVRTKTANPFTAAYELPGINDRTAVFEGLQDGKVMWWGTITISKDGKTRTAILHSTDAKWTKFTVKKVYDRI